ncbi:MAG TPA: hypothetical protein VFU47_07220 [Armatimonadota bacterium]|nr:hypothetical protein [Armatimonadota bacterium]
MQRIAYRAGALLVLLGGLCVAAVQAQEEPRIAILPTQYFSAGSRGAENVTRALEDQFAHNGYRVIPEERARAAFRSMELRPDRHYPDSVAVRFGQELDADLVAYPRLLGVGVPLASGPESARNDEAAAVLHLRVLNVHTGRLIYFRQVSQSFPRDPAAAGDLVLPPAAARSAAAEVTRGYFQRVAGTREEQRQPR